MPAKTMSCEYFVLCGKPTAKVIDHPVLAFVPCCLRCATRVGAEAELRTPTALELEAVLEQQAEFLAEAMIS